MDGRQVVEALLDKAADAGDAAQAVSFALAALNAAGALAKLAEVDLMARPRPSDKPKGRHK